MPTFLIVCGTSVTTTGTADLIASETGPQMSLRLASTVSEHLFQLDVYISSWLHKVFLYVRAPSNIERLSRM